MKELTTLLIDNEKWLMNKILAHAKKHDYTRYTSTLEEAWRLSIVGLSKSFIKNMEISGACPEIDPDISPGPLADFAVTEAINHRKRGVTMRMFLGLLKYYREVYLELCDHKATPPKREEYKNYLRWCFDAIEVELCEEWSKKEDKELLNELQTTNRFLTNEKNAYLTVFESLSDPIFMINVEKEVINLNHAAALLVGTEKGSPGKSYYSSYPDVTGESDNIINQPIFKLLPWLPAEALFDRANRSTKHFDVNTQINGEMKFFEITACNMLDVSEKFTATILTLKDLTSRKETEERLADALLTKNKFFSIIAHDLVSPFNALLGLSRILHRDQNSLPPDKQRDIFHRFYKSTSTLFRMITNLLDWSREQTNRITWNPQIFDIKNTTDEIIKMMEEVAQDKQVKIINNMKEHQIVFADENMIKTVLRNLLSNAVKFSHKGGHVTLGSKPVNNQIMISVEDNGVGIKDEDMDKLFKSSMKLQTPGTDNEIGTGLGLLLCNDFVKKNRGEIHVKSSHGEGSLFSFYLPTS